MKFRAHETFFIRKGWLSKGIKCVKENDEIFKGKTTIAMDTLGLGSNMVKSLKYWLQAAGLINKPIKGIYTLTELGNIILENDPYFEEYGTLCLIHYVLASNQELATSWYFFFNEFKLLEFDKDDFCKHLGSYIKMHGVEKISPRSIDDDFSCIVNTYISRTKLNPGKINPENVIDCPLGELNLIDIVNKKEKKYRKVSISKDDLHPLIAFAILIKQANGENEIKISSIKNDPCSLGKIFNLDIISITSVLYELELLGYLKVIRTAGLDVVRFTSELDYEECILEYYKAINNY